MEHEFGCEDMPECVDLMDNVFPKIVQNGEKIMDNDFMFGIFDPIKKKVPPYVEYLEYMFDHKISSLIGFFKTKDRVTPWDMLRCGLMIPTCSDIIQSIRMTGDIGVHAVIIMHDDFRNNNLKEKHSRK